MLTKRQAKLVRDCVKEAMEKEDIPENVRTSYSYSEFEAAKRLIDRAIEEGDWNE